MATSSLAQADSAYYQQQLQSIRNTYAIGQQETTNAQQGADLSYAQKLQSLNEKLGQEQAALPDKFAARGVQNSGIYGYGMNHQYTGGLGAGAWQNESVARGGQPGAEAQFLGDEGIARGDLAQQLTNVNQGYQLKQTDLTNTAANQTKAVNTTEAAQNAAQAQADAINGVVG